MAEKDKKRRKISDKAAKKNIDHAIVFINASFNNTIVTLTDKKGQVLGWSSSGAHGLKGSRKGTPYAAKLSGESVMQSAVNFGVKSVDVKINGPGSGRESALRVVAASGISINSIFDVTPIPHNGCRPPKRRRI